jgi:O-acetyl-ADP-ribose deacetylase (regulator of RNase III)
MQLPEDYVVDLTVQDPSRLRLLRGDLTEYPADAIVNAANADLLPGGGVCGAIHYKGGPEIARECWRLRRMDGPLRPGQAVATTGGNLQVKYVIHAVGPVWEGGNRGEARALASVYRESMRVADDLKLANIAFPAISTGIYRYPVAEAAWIAVSIVVETLKNTRHLALATIVLCDKSALDTFATAAFAFEQINMNIPI